MTTQERRLINRDFLIRLYINDKHKLIGAGMIDNYVDENTLKMIVKRLLDPKTVRYTYWNRKDLKIKFLPK